jgi:4-hydroxythreonine-4-phosphate dehydrogenase
MMMVSDCMRVALVCNHVPLRKVPEMITEERILNKLRTLEQTLRDDFTIEKPRIAVLALNPHAGDNGLIGTEEQEIIRPTVMKAVEEGMCVFGPYSADGFFGAGRYVHFDAVLAMYHDQGLAPFKLLAMEDGVNYTAGLDIVRTSPDHGTAYDIAGKSVADEASFRHAIYSAIDIFRARKAWDEAHQNPLEKLYVDKRDRAERG